MRQQAAPWMGAALQPTHRTPLTSVNVSRTAGLRAHLAQMHVRKDQERDGTGPPTLPRFREHGKVVLSRA